MRRVIVTIVAVLALQGAFPQPAHAWWDYIEQLSGPGPLRGFDIEARLVCWMQRPKDPEIFRITTLSAGGVILNLCERHKDANGNDEVVRRRGSVDAGFRYVWRGDDQRWAGGEPVRMITIEPAFMWNLIPGTRADVVEVGAGAGAYWFFSRGFPSFNGNFFELRADLRLPTAVHQKFPWLRPVVRYGRLWFPKGFMPEQFAAAAGQTIHEKSVNTYSFFWEIDVGR
jgi:hypothetical protein